MSPLLLIAGIGTAVYFGYIKPKQKKQQQSTPAPQPRILFDSECGWVIPDAWWTAVGTPKFTAILNAAFAGLTTWEQKLAVMGQATLNSHVVAYQILKGEGNATCVVPLPTSDVFNPPATLTKSQQNMYYLYADMINQVEAAMKVFAATAGTKILFPVPTPGA